MGRFTGTHSCLLSSYVGWTNPPANIKIKPSALIAAKTEFQASFNKSSHFVNCGEGLPGAAATLFYLGTDRDAWLRYLLARERIHESLRNK